MKHIKSILLMCLFAYILSGCTYWTMGTDESPRVESSNETLEANQYVYTDDMSDYKKIELNLDIDVSDITIKKVSNQTFTLTQRISQKKFFVIPTSEIDGDTLILSFNSPDQNLDLSAFNHQNSDVTIELPESLLYSIHSTVDVGKFDLNTDSLHFNDLEIATDVGDITVILNSDQAELKNINLSSDIGKVNLELQNDATDLESISLNSDVGDLTLSTSGNYPALQQMNISGDTGKVTLSMDGIYENAFTLDANSDIGQVKLDFAGQYAAYTKVRCSTSTGGLKLRLDENLKVKMFAEEDEFVSKIKFNDVVHTAQEDYFFINNANSNQFDMTIEANSDVGNIEVYN